MCPSCPNEGFHKKLSVQFDTRIALAGWISTSLTTRALQRVEIWGIHPFRIHEDSASLLLCFSTNETINDAPASHLLWYFTA
ncbi:protein of unknown function (plasmid) [Cupriavidus taiwanensis]|nr:protein of unknown function [Cupriavidus taiwanensis]SOZ72039.1 protein of unknown function [Cupriavidus taiwanensis]